MRLFYLTTVFLAASATVNAQSTPVWSTDVAPIIYNRCASCHHSGGIAPFNLMSYADVIAHASTVKAEVTAGTMPPWPPDPAYGRLAHERVLSSVEKTKILDWLAGGRPRGNTAMEPPAPTFSTTGDLPGTPDLVVKMPAYTSNAAMGDVYRCFVLPTGIATDKFITSFEAIPGNRAMVHHVLVYADTTGTSTTLDAQDPGPGYTSFGGIGTNSAVLLGGWVPGATPMTMPAGFGVRLSKKAKLVMQIHYPAGTAGMTDSTELHLFFAPGAVRNASISPVLNYYGNINAPLVVPANTVKTFTEQQMIPLDFTMIGITPHMHLLGQNIESFGVSPSGDTDRYISIPRWDFHWQDFYMLRQLKKIAAGTTVYARATYDNTTANPMNPNNPPKQVTAGEATTDEMMLVYFIYANYQQGDENIVVESTPATAVNTAQPYYKGVELLQPYPVPASRELIVKYHLDGERTGTIELLNAAGQTAIRVYAGQLHAGYTAMPIDVSGLPEGIYTLRLNAVGAVKSRVVSVRH